MNIAIVSYHTMGGSGIVAYEFGSALAERGHKVHFLGLQPPFRMNKLQGNVMFHSVEVKDYPVFTYPPYTLSLASKLFEVIEQYEIDVIHAHYAVPHAVAGILARNMTDRPVKLITTLHGTDITLVGSHPSFFSITKHAILNSDRVTAVSDFLKHRTSEVFGIDEKRITRIHNFVNEEYFNPELHSSCLDSQRSDADIIIHASNLREVKQPLDIVHIFKKIKEQYTGNCKLWIIGEGPKKNEMERFVSESGLKDSVEFFGITNNPGLYFAYADIFLLTSFEESFGLALLEAMACRTAAVAYGSGGVPEVVQNGKSGILLPHKDIDGMAASCVELLNNKERLETMKEAAHIRAVTDFGRDAIVEEYLSLCEYRTGNNNG